MLHSAFALILQPLCIPPLASNIKVADCKQQRKLIETQLQIKRDTQTDTLKTRT